jgi:xanthine dehydrogenase YagS FAD-binding subunit
VTASFYAPGTLDEAAALLGGLGPSGGEARAGGTDVQERRSAGRSTGTLVDLTRIPGLTSIDATPDGGVRIGALVTVHRLATDAALATYPALRASAGALATPQLRRQGTLGGNLLQDLRCTYARTEGFECLHTGGERCLARDGFQGMHVVFDDGPCIAPHASTIAMALLTDPGTVVEVVGGPDRSVPELYGDLSDPRRVHALEPGELIAAVHLPPARPREGGHYLRAISRARAEWPLVEAAARVVLDGDVIAEVGVAAGGIARAPRRLAAVEDAACGRRADAATVAAAAAVALDGANPVPGSAFKLRLLETVVADALEGAIAHARAARDASS